MTEPRKVTPQALRQSLHRAARRGNPLAQTYLYRLDDAEDKQAEAEDIMAELEAQVTAYLEAVRPIALVLGKAVGRMLPPEVLPKREH